MQKKQLRDKNGRFIKSKVVETGNDKGVGVSIISIDYKRAYKNLSNDYTKLLEENKSLRAKINSLNLKVVELKDELASGDESLAELQNKCLKMTRNNDELSKKVSRYSSALCCLENIVEWFDDKLPFYKRAFYRKKIRRMNEVYRDKVDSIHIPGYVCHFLNEMFG